MTFVLTYPPKGRGAFPDTGIGGTLNVTGTAPGRYYRAPANAKVKMPGTTGALAVKIGSPCSINDYAVYWAVKSIQKIVGADVDGRFGPMTGGSVTNYQRKHVLTADGVVGPVTSRVLFKPLVEAAALAEDVHHADLLFPLTMGHLNAESKCDAGAVGWADPYDIGIGQINAPSHPDVSTDTKLNVATAIPWMVHFIDRNLKVMDYVLDDAIVAYNLGISGASAWIAAGRPDKWGSGAMNVRLYIDMVKKGMDL